MSGRRKPRPVTFLCGNPCFCSCHYSLRRVEESRHRNRKCQRDDDKGNKNKAELFFQSHLASSIQKACEPPPASSKRRRWGRKRAARAAGPPRRAAISSRAAQLSPQSPSSSAGSAFSPPPRTPQPTHLLPPLHTHTSTELPKISTLRPPPSLTSFQHFLSWMILGFVREEKKEGIEGGRETGCLLFVLLKPSEGKIEGAGKRTHAARRGLLASRGGLVPRARVLS